MKKVFLTSLFVVVSISFAQSAKFQGIFNSSKACKALTLKTGKYFEIVDGKIVFEENETRDDIFSETTTKDFFSSASGILVKGTSEVVLNDPYGFVYFNFETGSVIHSYMYLSSEPESNSYEFQEFKSGGFYSQIKQRLSGIRGRLTLREAEETEKEEFIDCILHIFSNFE